MASKTVHKTCNMCEATCGLLINVEDNRVVKIRADDNDPFSRGHICPKAFALQEIQEDPDRIKFPMKRTGKGWQRIGWDEAFEEVAENIARLQKQYGEDTVATYMGNPSAHNFGTALYGIPLLKTIHSRNKYSASSVDQNPKHASSLFLFGTILSMPIPDLDRTQYLLILGANPMTSNGSIMTAPDIRTRLNDIRKRGGKIVVVDPRRTETAKMADRHIAIRPGLDGLLLAAVINVIFAEKLGREGPATKYLADLDMLKKNLAPFTPEAVAPALGIGADEIRTLAREFAGAPSASCYGRIGTCLHEFGTLSSWLVDVLNLVTGNLDRPGGAMFTSPAADLLGSAPALGLKGHHNAWQSRVRGLPEFNGELPAAVLAEEILTPGPGQVRGFVSIAGNPVLSTPNGKQLEEALSRLDFYVAFDIYINETTRFANIILPPTWSLEHDNYEFAFHMFAVRNTTKYSPKVLDAEPGTMDEWKILTEVNLRLMEKKAKNPAAKLAASAARRLGLVPEPRTILDGMIRMGRYGDKFLPWKKGLSLKKLEESPSGIDLGPLQPELGRVLQTKDKKIHLSHPLMDKELERLRGFMATQIQMAGKANGRQLMLIGRRDLRTNNSWAHNVKSLVKGGARCDLIMNPDDAGLLGLKHHDNVKVKSRVGEVTTRLAVSDEIMRGVVSLPHGWGHRREGVQLSVAVEFAGVSCNDLTDDKLVEPIVGNAILNGVPVTVERAAVLN